MAFGINNPIPQSLNSECKKVAKILTSFVKPNQVIRYEEVIPPHVLQNAQGLCVMTILRAGFLFSGRAGSGLIVARLPDGTWSPPSACMSAGAGAGGMIGADLTDFIFILNTQEAVKTFASAGALTLGGNVSLAAGPLGRSGEAAAAAGTSGAATVFSYSKSKGLYAGVSLEGSVIIERKDANQKFYGRPIPAKQILSGHVPAPPGCEPLFRVLDSRAFRDDVGFDEMDDDFYDDLPDAEAYDDAGSMRSYRGPSTRQRSSRGGSSRGGYDDEYDDRRSSRRQFDDIDEDYATGRGRRDDYDRSRGASNYDRNDRSSYRGGASGASSGRGYTSDYDDDRYRRRRDDDYDDQYRDEKRYGRDARDTRDTRDTRDSRDSRDARDRDARDDYSRPPQPEPRAPASSGYGTQALALYAFAGEESGDLAFKKGDVINVVSKSDSVDDWWTGELNGRKGIFPANYVELV